VPIKPALPRHTVEYLDGNLQITLPSKKNYLRMVWYVVWLAMWAFISLNVFIFIAFLLGGVVITFVSSAGKAGDPTSFLLILAFLGFFFVALVAMGGAVLYDLLWQIVGREVISVDPEQLQVARQLFGLNKTSDYSLVHVSDLRVGAPTQISRLLPKVFALLLDNDGMIAFDYGAKTYRFGLEIDEAEAKQIVGKILERLPR
jgi:hypothetical protein